MVSFFTALSTVDKAVKTMIFESVWCRNRFIWLDHLRHLLVFEYQNRSQTQILFEIALLYSNLLFSLFYLFLSGFRIHRLSSMAASLNSSSLTLFLSSLCLRLVLDGTTPFRCDVDFVCEWSFCDRWWWTQRYYDGIWQRQSAPLEPQPQQTPQPILWSSSICPPRAILRRQRAILQRNHSKLKTNCSTSQTPTAHDMDVDMCG